jgi:hypothetical protein
LDVAVPLTLLVAVLARAGAACWRALLISVACSWMMMPWLTN